jgi:hypothetical protein
MRKQRSKDGAPSTKRSLNPFRRSRAESEGRAEGDSAPTPQGVTGDANSAPEPVAASEPMYVKSIAELHASLRSDEQIVTVEVVRGEQGLGIGMGVGMMVTHLRPGAPGEQAGVKEGDQIVMVGDVRPADSRAPPTRRHR